MLTAIKPKTCKGCRKKFRPMSSFARACSWECSLLVVEMDKANAAKLAQAQDKKQTREKLLAMKPLAYWIAKAQTAFNAWVRLRDAGKPCICCGRTKDSSAAPGGEWDAGHYRSRGSAPHLRFDERNVHAQLKYCNRHGSGNVVGYRLGLIERIGLAAVEALEADQTPRRYRAEELKAIIADYTARARELRKVSA